MQKNVLVVVIILLGLFFVVAAMVLVRLLVQKHLKSSPSDDLHIADGSLGRQSQMPSISSSWNRLFGARREQKGPWVPSLSGILKAGEEGFCSSTMFTSLPGHAGRLPMDALYEAFANELRARPLTERSSYSGEVARFLSESKRGTSSGLGRTRSVSHKAASMERRDTASKAFRKSLDFSTVEMGLVRGISVKRPRSVLVSMYNGLKEEGEPKKSPGAWMKDGQTATLHEGRRSVKVTSAELAALSIVLGSPLTRSTDTSFEKGAYGISIQSTPLIDGKRQVSLRPNAPSVSQQHAQGKGVSLLFAKHLAAGSLPYAQDKKAVKCILVTTESMAAIRAGASLYTHSTTVRTPQSRFLSSLPSSRGVSFHVLASSTEIHYSKTLTNAISALPFVGGLPPLATRPMADAIGFIASGGLSPGRLLSRLEALVEKVHRQAPHLTIFGPMYEPQHAGILYREHQRLRKVRTDATVTDSLADKTARMSRYVTLLERLMALVPGRKPQEILAAVQEATKLALQRSYADAVAAHAGHNAPKDGGGGVVVVVATNGTPTPEAKSQRQSVASRTSARHSKRASIMSSDSDDHAASQTRSDSFADASHRTLGKQLEQVLKADLPLSVEMIAQVARMVLVAWTLSVGFVAWEYGESGFRVPDVAGLGDRIEMR